ncbi:ABC transporter ATP-binding protein [Candidatus Poribacteria bacterium]|nr:ABC transporter ATP-binding protein [Candidatus Poribacteria bacterium]
MKLLESMPHSIRTKTRELLPTGEEELIRVSTDLNQEGRFGEQWVVVTDKRLLIVPTARVDGVIEVPIQELILVQTEALVGGGHLSIERKGKPTIIVPYSSSLAEKFSEVARGLEQLRKEEPFLINPQLERTRCGECGRLLPEKNGICPNCIRRLATLQRIASYLKPYRGHAILLAIVSLMEMGTTVVPPMLTREIVDSVLVPKEGNTNTMSERLTLLGLLVLGLVGIRVVNWGLQWAHGWTVSWLGARITADIRNRLYQQLELLSLQFYDRRQVGAVMSRVTRDAGRLQEFLVEGLPYLIISALTVVGILGVLFWMHWLLALLVLIPIPFMMGWGVMFWKRMRLYFNKWDQAWSDLMTTVSEVLSGIRVVKAFAQEAKEIVSFGVRNKKIRQLAIRTEINWEIFFATTTLLTSFGILIVWLLGGREVIRDTLTLGTLLTFYAYMWMLYDSIEWFGEVNSWMTRAFAGAERIFEVIDTPAEAYKDPTARSISNIKGHVRFTDVTFGYDKSKPVLHEINLDVVPGEMVGLVGRSGVGKTTTVNLICRFYDVDQGIIEVDGVPIQKIRLEDLRSQIGIVPQEPFLFSGTVAENISYGKPGASFEEIMDAAIAANAHSFIVAKSDGYDSQVGERGGELSGGEKQRLAIARAILHDPKILILDEATSSVDVETEQHIQDAIARLTEGRTTFAIAHRLSTLRNADRLVILEGGRIVEVGTHNELMEKRGIFYELVQLQQQTSEIIAVKA